MPDATTSRRHLLYSMSSLAVSTLIPLHANAKTVVGNLQISAVAFDALAILDPRPVFRLAEDLFPGRGEELSDVWRTRQFEYTWLRNSMRQYEGFWQVTLDALNYVGRKCGVEIDTAQRTLLMSAYLQLKPYPDVEPVLKELRRQGLGLAILSNFTVEMMQSCLKISGLECPFDYLLSTDQAKTFKPAPAAYALAIQALALRKNQIAFVAFGGWDASGAKAFGYPTFWANRNFLPIEELSKRPDAVGHDLSELPGFVVGRGNHADEPAHINVVLVSDLVQRVLNRRCAHF